MPKLDQWGPLSSLLRAYEVGGLTESLSGLSEWTTFKLVAALVKGLVSESLKLEVG